MAPTRSAKLNPATSNCSPLVKRNIRLLYGIKRLCHLEYRLLNPFGFAAGQLVVFQGASEEPVSSEAAPQTGEI
jgi:hypothetical protein